MRSKNNYNSELKNRIKHIRLIDLLSFFPMIIGFLISLFYRLKHRRIWLICERRGEARDNGYWFYKYMCENHSEIESVFAIKRDSPDFNKVKDIGKTVEFGSIMHWVNYFAARRNISSQKEGKPNVAMCFFLEVILGLVNNRVYLKHGIIKDDQRWIYYDVSKITQINCAAFREFEYVKKKFGYPEENVKLTGLCRYDNLLSKHKTSNMVLIMPTMREWLRNIDSDTLKYENSDNFEKTEYFNKWDGLLRSEQLYDILNKFDIYLVFYLHSSMQKYIDYFNNDFARIEIADSKKHDVQQLLMESKLLITDYSSIFFDFAYMKKPLIYYQFDYEKYRLGQYQEGYFSYIDDGFGPVIKEETDLVREIENIVKRNFSISELYMLRSNNFFTFNDNQNCERTYKSIIEMKKRKF